jgi:hypothetical protein
MGNFLWGATTYIMGVPESLALLGAPYNSLFGESGDGDWDSPDDQYSIKLGRNYAKIKGLKEKIGSKNNKFR